MASPAAPPMLAPAAPLIAAPAAPLMSPPTVPDTPATAVFDPMPAEPFPAFSPAELPAAGATGVELDPAEADPRPPAPLVDDPLLFPAAPLGGEALPPCPAPSVIGAPVAGSVGAPSTPLCIMSGTQCPDFSTDPDGHSAASQATAAHTDSATDQTLTRRE
ncbi:MAG TPA: hypothetical protein VFG30_39880 [Polyangiales bacterium]|nr:hypothetical protein [Polyangiales bacterium]